jgi:6-phosphogluconolactonase
VSTIVFRDLSTPDALAARAAADLAEKLKELLSSKATVQIVVTGGSVGIKTLEHLGPLLSKVNLSSLQIWWGDERFVERESPDRNFVQAREALLSKISIPQENVHEMPALEAGGLLEASANFADFVAGVTPEFDVVLLGMGPDGHVASLFPNSEPVLFGEWIIAEPNSPKPPRRRISFSYQALSSATEVWFLVAGSDKADAVAQAFSGAQLPAGLVRGKKVTKWYLDEAAAGRLTS